MDGWRRRDTLAICDTIIDGAFPSIRVEIRNGATVADDDSGVSTNLTCDDMPYENTLVLRYHVMAVNNYNLLLQHDE